MSDQPYESSTVVPQRQAADTTGYRPLRIWPPLLLICGMLFARMIPQVVENGPANLWMSAAFGPAICGILIAIWWVTLSRATWLERLVGVIGIVAAAATTLALVDRSMIGPGTMVLTVPMGMASFGVGAALFGRILSFRRTVIAILLAICGFGFSTLLRSDGLWGNFALGLHWRFLPSAEEELLAERAGQPAASATSPSSEEFEQWLAEPEWPAFRGAERTGRQHGTSIASDWSRQPPERIWSIAVGPGWSSFAVAGELPYTQEQRGPMETVVCYHADTGQEVWTHTTASRFEDTLGGPGPRATPTLSGGGLFVMGASGQLMRLDPRTGDLVWEQDLREVANREPPVWGFCSSPLVFNQLVIVHSGGAGDKGTLAFDAASGELRWSAAAGDHSYSSPQLGNIGGRDVVMILTNLGISLHDPETGQQQLSYEWKHEGYRSLQPQTIDGNSVLLPTGMGTGTRRIGIIEDDGTWTATEEWTSLKLKSDFNDFVVHQGHACGFDGAIFTCIDLKTGEAKWKRGRYGKGQVLLLADASLLLVAGERGEVVLLRADPSGHQELGKFQAIEGKTWNHPVVVGDRLFIRNSQEAACYRLPLAETSS